MTTTLLPLPQDVDHGSDAEAIANLYATLLTDHGWRVEVAKSHHPGHYDADGQMWSKELVNVALTATRDGSKGDGYLVVSWTSVIKAPHGVDLNTRRNKGFRQSGDVLNDAVEVVSNYDFFKVIAEMTA